MITVRRSVTPHTTLTSHETRTTKAASAGRFWLFLLHGTYLGGDTAGRGHGLFTFHSVCMSDYMPHDEHTVKAPLNVLCMPELY